jgi:hypothetical protein
MTDIKTAGSPTHPAVGAGNKQWLGPRTLEITELRMMTIERYS